MNYTPIQLKLPVDMERIIEINDSVYAFNEVVSHIDLKSRKADPARFRRGSALFLWGYLTAPSFDIRGTVLESI